MTVTQINATVGINITPLQTGLQTAQQQVLQFSQTLQITLTQAANKATAPIDALSARLRTLGNDLSRTGAAMTRNISLPLAILGTTAVRTTAAFEDSLNQLKGATGANAAQMEILRQKAVALGQDLTLPGTSAKTAAEAELELARAGLNVRDVFDSVRPAMELSAATHISNAEAARILAVTENQFGVAAKDSARAADILTAAGNRTVGGVQALFQGLKLVGPVMSGLRVPMGDTVTALALLQKNGMLGSMAGSALKTSLSLLADPSKKAREVLAALNIHLFDGTGKFIGMSAAAGVLHEKLGKLTDQQRLMVEHTLGGTRAMLALNILAKEGAAGFDKMAASVNKAGEAHRQAAIQMTGLPGAIKAVQTAFQAAQVAAIEPIKTALAGLLFKLADLLTAFTKLSPGTRTAIAGFTALAIATGPLLIGLGKVIVALAAVSKGMAEIKAGVAIAQMSSTGAAMKGLGNIFTWAKGIIVGVVAYLGGPVVAALAVAAAAVGLFVVAWTRDWFDIQEQFKAAWDTITQIFNQVLPTIQSAWTAFTDMLQGNWADAWTNMKRVVVDVVGFIGKLLTDPIGTIKGLMAQFGENFHQEQLNKAARTPAPAPPGLGALGASGTHTGFAPGGTFNPALDAIGKGVKKAQSDSEKLNDALADAQRRLALLQRGMNSSLVDVAQQYNNDQTVAANDPRLKQLDHVNKLTKAIEDQRTGVQNFKDAWTDLRNQIRLAKSELASGLTGGGEVADVSKKFKANIPTKEATGFAGDTDLLARLQKQIEAKKELDKLFYQQERQMAIFDVGDTSHLLKNTPDEIRAMQMLNKTENDLTAADTARVKLYVENQRNLERAQTVFKFLDEEENKVAQATLTSALALQSANREWEAFGSKTKYAAEALQLLGVPLRKLSQEDAKNVVDALKQIDRNQAAMTAYKSFADGVKGIFNDMFMNVNKGFSGMVQSFVQGFEKMLQQMAAQYLASQLAKLFVSALGNAFGGKGAFADILGGLSGRASGGLVSQDTPYLVGENGPELFMPGRSGRMLSNSQTAAAMAGGGGVTVNMTVHTADANSFNRSQHQIASDMRRMVQQAGKRTGR